MDPHLAQAVIDMDDIAWGEGLGPSTGQSQEQWRQMVRRAERQTNRLSRHTQAIRKSNETTT